VAYVRQVARAVKPGGHVIVAAFGPEGPTKCSGLDVARYERHALHDKFGARFELVDHLTDLHLTPAGAVQQFIYCYCRVASQSTARGLPSKNWSKDNFKARGYGGSTKDNRAMRKSRFSAEQISTAVRQVESGAPVAEVTRKLGVGENCGRRFVLLPRRDRGSATAGS
jgi:hypothetical protein